MANYVSIETQYTPLDVDGLQNNLKKQGFFHKISKPSTIFLVIGIVAFLGSLMYAITGEKVKTQTKAEGKKQTAPQISSVPIALNPVTTSITELPNKYRDVTIPESLYADIKTNYAVDSPGRKNYVIDKIVRFYIYQEVLEEEELTYQSTEEDIEERTFANLLKDVTAMELVIKENIVGTDKKYLSIDKLVVDRLTYFTQ